MRALESNEELKTSDKDKIGTSMHVLTGRVVSSKMRSTVTVQIDRRVMLPKYERFAKRYSVIKAHNPRNVGAETGDVVTIAECRPISKTKHFIVVKKHGSKTGGDE